MKEAIKEPQGRLGSEKELVKESWMIWYGDVVRMRGLSRSANDGLVGMEWKEVDLGRDPAPGGWGYRDRGLKMD